MKRLTILMMVMLLGAVSLMARPGYSKPVDVKQPDGTTVTLLMHGDEYLSFMTTTDGYTVIKGDDGFYRYAEKQDGLLKATSMVAKNPDVRTGTEQAFLARVKKYLHPVMSAEQQELKRMASQMYSPGYARQDGSHRVTTIWDRINYSNFKGLVVLVEFSDRKFLMDDPKGFYQKLTSEKNYRDDSKTNYPVPVTGSSRDYFYDNSMGMFDPTFDVVGPVQIGYSCTYPTPKDQSGQVTAGYYSRLINILKASMNAANDVADFSQYDLNADGTIDMIYFIFAGYGSYVQGNDYRYTWPHANDLSSVSSTYGMKYDGKWFGRYACSVEIQDYEEYAAMPGHPWLDGIGTMCHEFSHVLGLADHYDTNYDEDGQAPTAGYYDVMDAGADRNYGLTPVGYNAFERYLLGFTELHTLTEPGSYELQPFDKGNKCYVVQSAKTSEEFYIENRQNQGWDTYLPGKGLLIWRADTSDPSIWRANIVNTSPDNMHFELIGQGPYENMDLTAAECESWGKKGAAIDLFDITETDGVITFKAGKNLYETYVEDFENSPLTDGDATGVAGQFCTWDLVNAAVVATDGTYGKGNHVAKIGRSGKMTSSVFETGLRTLKFKVQNGSKRISFSLNVNTGDGKWTALGGSSTDIGKNKSQEFSFVNVPAGSQIQFNVLATKNDATCYIDDISVTFPDVTGVETLAAPSASRPSAMYNLSGQRVGNNYRGLVIVNGKKVVKK